MPYVRRDTEGRVIALSLEALEGFERVEADLPAIQEFEQQMDGTKTRLQESDRDVVRVLDDLINVLVDHNLIRFTDLPHAAQHKLIERRGLREGGVHLGLLGDDTSLL